MLAMSPHSVQGWQIGASEGIDDALKMAKGLDMDTKTQLLDSAEHAVRARGYDGFSYADLAAEVGIRKASIHYHYPTKADLGLALIQRYREGIHTRFVDIAETGKNAGVKLKAYLKFYRDAMEDGDIVCLCVAFAISRDTLAEPILKELNQFHDANIKWLTGVYSEARDDTSIANVGEPAQEAAMTLALVEGGHLIARSAKDLKRFDAAVKHLKSRIV